MSDKSTGTAAFFAVAAALLLLPFAAYAAGKKAKEKEKQNPDVPKGQS